MCWGSHRNCRWDDLWHWGPHPSQSEERTTHMDTIQWIQIWTFSPLLGKGEWQFQSLVSHWQWITPFPKSVMFVLFKNLIFSSTFHAVASYILSHLWIWMNFHQLFEKCSILFPDIRKQPQTSFKITLKSRVRVTNEWSLEGARYINLRQNTWGHPIFFPFNFSKYWWLQTKQFTGLLVFIKL